jgi:hypothetical protein
MEGDVMTTNVRPTPGRGPAPKPKAPVSPLWWVVGVTLVAVVAWGAMSMMNRKPARGPAPAVAPAETAAPAPAAPPTQAPPQSPPPGSTLII